MTLLTNNMKKINFIIRNTENGCSNNIPTEYDNQANCPVGANNCSQLNQCQSSGPETDINELRDENDDVVFSTVDDPSNYITGQGLTIQCPLPLSKYYQLFLQVTLAIPPHGWMELFASV